MPHVAPRTSTRKNHQGLCSEGAEQACELLMLTQAWQAELQPGSWAWPALHMGLGGAWGWSLLWRGKKVCRHVSSAAYGLRFVSGVDWEIKSASPKKKKKKKKLFYSWRSSLCCPCVCADVSSTVCPCRQKDMLEERAAWILSVVFLKWMESCGVGGGTQNTTCCRRGIAFCCCAQLSFGVLKVWWWRSWIGGSFFLF